MQAGRELDALVAEKVMGWTMAPASFGPTQHVYQCWHANGQPIMTIHMWNPTEDIAAAWLVVEKMKELRPKDAVIVFWQGDEWNCIIDEFKHKEISGFEKVWEGADTAPLAICLAALKAVGA